MVAHQRPGVHNQLVANNNLPEHLLKSSRQMLFGERHALAAHPVVNVVDPPLLKNSPWPRHQDPRPDSNKYGDRCLAPLLPGHGILPTLPDWPAQVLGARGTV